MKLIPPTQSINFSPTINQDKCWQFLQDKQHSIIFYGGAAGGGKSYLACSWITITCLSLPGVVMGLTRSRLIDLKKSSMITLFLIFKQFGLVEGKQFSFDRTTNIITFWNGSKILMFDSFLYPSDFDFERLSSIEMTGCVIDEASQTSKKAFNIIQTRLRYKHAEYNLIPKLLICSNPTNNFIKSEIYLPFQDGTLQEHIAVQLCKAIDNPYIDKSYISNLETLDQPIKARLLYGDWEYMDNDASIFDNDHLVQMFYNSSFMNNSMNKYLTCDVAALGSDSSVITIWEGLQCIDIQKYNKNTIPQLYTIITNLMTIHHIPIHQVVIDRTGVGTGLHDMLKGSVGFISNSTPTNIIYKQLKDEMFYKLAEYINTDRIYFSVKKFQDEIVQELQLHSMYNYDKDQKTQITPKDKIKQLLGRSPDFADALSMRMYFEVKQQGFSFTIL